MKYKARFYPSKKIITKGNPMVDPAIVWKVPSSSGSGSYDVQMHDKGYSCTCPAFTFRGECKHAKHVDQHLIRCFDA